MTPASGARALVRLPRIVLPLCAALLACVIGAAPAMARPVFPSVTRPLSVKIISRPPAFSRSSSARFIWKAVSAKGVACRLNGHAYAPCKSGHVYRNLQAGRHTFRVRVKRNGKIRVAMARWTIDLTRPTVPTVAGGSSSWVTGSVDVSASGSTDVGSGLAGYQHRVSANNTLWTAPAAGASTMIAASGSYQVEFRARDRAGNVSPWSAPATAMVDNSAPSAPALSGAGAGWQSVDQEDVLAAGSIDAQSGIAYYQFRTSGDGGASWSAWAQGTDAAVVNEGPTLVQFEAVNGVGLVSPVAQSEVEIDRTAPSVPAVSGGSAAWQSAATVNISASGSTDNLSGVTYQYETSTDGGGSWSQPLDGASAPISAEGTTEVQFRAVDGAGNASAWSPADDQSTVMLDHTAPSVPSVGGGSGSWLHAASETITALGSSDALSGIAGYQYQTSTDGGVTWSGPVSANSLTVSDEGQTLVQFRAVDNANNASAWSTIGAGSTVKLDRTAPAVSATGGSTNWLNATSATISVSASDAGSGIDASSYQYRTSTNNGSTWSAPAAGGAVTVSTAGTTLVQFQVKDQAGNVSAWGPQVGTAGATVMLDAVKPTTPTSVTGGSTLWSTAASKTITASGSTDVGSGVAGYQYETSFNNGAWSAAQNGSSAVISAEGTTKVQFRSIDYAGNVSNWTIAGSSATVRLDRTAPSLPTVTGGSTTCTSKQIMIKASSTDSGSGVAGYHYRTSTNGGTTWSTPGNGSSVKFRTKGTWIVQFQAYDAAGNTSAWAPATAGSANTACHS
jgi:large repetitive protein